MANGEVRDFADEVEDLQALQAEGKGTIVQVDFGACRGTGTFLRGWLHDGKAWVSVKLHGVGNRSPIHCRIVRVSWS